MGLQVNSNGGIYRKKMIQCEQRAWFFGCVVFVIVKCYTLVILNKNMYNGMQAGMYTDAIV